MSLKISLAIHVTNIDENPFILSSQTCPYELIAPHSFYFDLMHMPWLSNAVYCPAPYRNKQKFWDQLEKVTESFYGPIFTIGDFNSVLFQSEKLGGFPIACTSSPKGLQLYMEKFGFMDLVFSDLSRIRERLDQGISNISWSNLFPESNVYNLNRTAFDHSHILLNTSNPNSSPKSFKFEEFWTYNPTIHDVIRDAWKQNFNGTPAFVLTKKLKAAKNTLKIWNQTSFVKIQTRIRMLNQALQKVQTQDPSQVPSNLENDLKEQLNETLKKKESLWKQKSRITWLTTIDLTTNFIHTSTIVRRRRNRIGSLKIGNGNWTFDQNVMNNKFQEHFQRIYQTSNPIISEDLKNLFPTKINENENLFLSHVPSEMEIWDVVKQTPSTKAPGPDGFTKLFYKIYWEVIKIDLVAAIQNFFINGKLLKELNHTNIALIPKKDSPNKVHNFIPISLSNVCYKFILLLPVDSFRTTLL
ncbi:hypothetical protein CIPAW_06G015500 [Carya illinoinensis]|uniref:Uncharacterized protein n=1 Tax=Carya illinoinensis TaxID=32201 RepID=A0A8T1Q5J8_CARIL|nr:hypothetical protein CIPAW_06G015500 [Carya illinoinensis]